MYAVRITRCNGVQTIHTLARDQVTIGSSYDADICLTDVAGVLPHHVLLAPREDSCWVSAVQDAPLRDRRGKVVSGAYVPWGSRLTLGECAFELCDVSAEGEPLARRNQNTENADKANESTESARGGIHPILLMLLIGSFAFAAHFGWSDAKQERGIASRQAPTLFEEVRRSCQSGNPAHRASIAEEQALAKRERSVFDLHDGVLAVALFAEAEDCYRKAGSPSSAEDVLRIGTAFRQDMEEEYDLLRLRLSRDLAAGNVPSARFQVERLSEIFRHRPGSEYGLTLRRLSTRLSKQGQTL